MNKLLYQILPIYHQEIKVDEKLNDVIGILKEIICEKNNIAYPYKGIVTKEAFKFSKRDISPNVKSELVFKGHCTPINHSSTKITVKGSYKPFPTITVLFLMVIFAMVAWSIENYPIRAILPLMPYVVMTVKIKTRSPDILYDLENAFK